MLARLRPRSGLQARPHDQALARPRRPASVRAAQRRRPAASGADDDAPTTSPPTPPPTPPALWKWEDSDDALAAYATLLASLAAGPAAASAGPTWACYPYFLALATASLYIASHKALTSRERRTLSVRAGALLPLGAGATLGLAYLLLKAGWNPRAFLDVYFFGLGSVAVASAAGPPLRTLARWTAAASGGGGGGGGQQRADTGWAVAVPPGLLLDGEGSPVSTATLRPSDAVAALLGLAVAAADAAAHHHNFTLSNAIACAVATDVLSLVGLSSFRAAGVALAGLAVYDAAAVFGSSHFTPDGESIMLSVASSDLLAGPTRLLFPQDGAALARAASDAAAASPFPLPLEESAATAATTTKAAGGSRGGLGFSLLGLGDVVVPGTLVALALRFDGSRSVDLRPRAAAVAAAIDAAMAASPPGAGDREIGEAAADAAEAAYDSVADGPGVGAPPPPAGASSRPPVTDAVLAGPRTYFTAALTAYALGLGGAFLANGLTHAGQPALVYIVPAMLGGVAWTAASRREVGRVLEYTDGGSGGMAAEKSK